ncbi:MAG: DUF6273 domain-containing protein [Acutalibacteraceae bacterium]
MNISQAIALDFGRNTIPITIFAKQNDTESRFIEITPLNCGKTYVLESGITARLQLTKPDGHTVINDASIGDGKITAELTQQALAVAGVAVAEIGLYKDTALLSSQIFYINVERAAYDSSSPTSADEYNALISALGQVAGAVSEANKAAGLATNKASYANNEGSRASAAASAANRAADNANSAAETANTAANSVNDATDNALTATSKALQAAEKANSAAFAAIGAENVNISAEQTSTGADITVTDRTGTATTIHIDTLTAINTWEDVRNAVRMGLGATLFPVGYEFTTFDYDTGLNIVWVVSGHDHHTPTNSRLAHSMTLEMKFVYSNSSGAYKSIQFDSPEALYYARVALDAGTYNFTWDYTSGLSNSTYQFTLSHALPAGGQITLNASSMTVNTYSAVADTTVLETVTLTEGSDGTSLGTTGSGNLNRPQRVLYGSNNYAQSAVRQWLNSAQSAGAVWTASNIFDRFPSWITSYNGFMHGLPADFLEVVQAATVPCRTNSVYETNSIDGSQFSINQVYNLTDKFFLLSYPEMYGSYDNTSYKDGSLLEYYDGLTNAERIKRDYSGSSRYAWLRSPYPGYANGERIVSSSGGLSSNNASGASGVAAACIIA